MGIKAKPLITLNRDALDAAMAENKINGFTELAHRLHVDADIDDVSVSSIWRWNREGWPARKFRRLCTLLGALHEQLAAPDETH